MDLAELAYAAREGSSEERLRLIEALVSMIVARRAPTKQEIQLFEDILQNFLPTIDEAGRARLSDRLAEWPRLSRKLTLVFAKDVIAVAKPVLMRSPNLDDKTLIDLMRSVGEAHCVAMARRVRLPGTVADALAQRGGVSVLAELAGNMTAILSTAIVRQLVDEAMRHPELATVLVLRHDLSDRDCDRVVEVIAARLRARIREDVLAPKPEAVVERPHLTPADLVGKCRDGELSLDEAIVALAEDDHQTEIAILLSERSGFDEVQVVKVLVRPDASGIQMVMKALGCSSETFRAVCKMRQHLLRFDKLRLTWEVDDYIKLPEAKAKETLAGLKRKKVG